MTEANFLVLSSISVTLSLRSLLLLRLTIPRMHFSIPDETVVRL